MKIFVIALVCLALPFATAYFIDDSSESEVTTVASVTVSRSDSVSRRSLITGAPLPESAASRVEQKAELMALLTAPSVLERASESLGEGEPRVTAGSLKSTLESGLSMTHDPAHGLTRITLEMDGDLPAVDVLTMLLDDPEIAGKNSTHGNRGDALSIEAAEQELSRADAALTGFEHEHALTDRKAEQKHLMDLSASLYGKLVELKQEHEGAKAETLVLERELARTPVEVVQQRTVRINGVYVKAVMDLFDLEMERDEVASKYVETSPWRLRVEAKIAALRGRIAEVARDEVESRTWARNPQRDGLHVRAIEARIASAVSEAMIGVVEREQSGLWARALKLNELARDHDALLVRRSEAVESLTRARNIETQRRWERAESPAFVLVGRPESFVVTRPQAGALLGLAPLGIGILLGIALLCVACRYVVGASRGQRLRRPVPIERTPSWSMPSEPMGGSIALGAEFDKTVVASSTSSQRARSGRRAPRHRPGMLRDLYWVLRGREIGNSLRN